MDQDQILKRLDWLDEERRKDKLLIATLQDRIADLEENHPAVLQRLNEQEGALARISTSLARFDQNEAAIGQVRIDVTRMIQEIEKQRAEHIREIEKVRLADMESLQRAIGENRKGLESIPDLKKSLQSRLEGENNLHRELEELNQKLTQIRRSDEEYHRQLKLLDDGQRQDSKRLTDLQGEVGALRKRVEEQRGKNDLVGDAMRKIELRISEIQSAETERRNSQIAFIEKQNMTVIDRDRIWKEWQGRFEQIEAQSLNLDVQVQSLEATNRSVKRSQEAFDEITARFERRINEITEMQRLVEDRFRQEWVSFKAEDQKRWTNYSLSQEEQQREMGRDVAKTIERIVTLEDLIQEIQDLLQQVNEETGKGLQLLLAATREWAERHTQVLGHTR